jgi:hypothetical protein
MGFEELNLEGKLRLRRLVLCIGALGGLFCLVGWRDNHSGRGFLTENGCRRNEGHVNEG